MNLKVKFKEIDQKMKVSFDSFQTLTITDKVQRYVGEYYAIPKTEKQVFSTNQKFMTQDFKVGEIPVFNVQNSAGGTTVYIGKEV